MWQAPHRDHSLVIEVYRMVIKQKKKKRGGGRLLLVCFNQRIRERRIGLDRKRTGGVGGWLTGRKDGTDNFKATLPTLFWGIKSAFVLDKRLTPL